MDRTKEHKLIDMIVIAICAVICGAEGWTDIENFGKSKFPWLKTFLELPNGIPSPDTFGRVFSLLDAKQFQPAFYEWVLAVNEIVQGQIIKIDGKRLAGSEDRLLGKRAIYMVSAWADENEIVLGQRKVDEKSNEITAIPEFLQLLVIAGCIVTIDAMGTQTHIAKTIREAEADYVLSVKENQGLLFVCRGSGTELQVCFAGESPRGQQRHGRIETRECWSTAEPAYLNLIRDSENWSGLRRIAMLVSTRLVAGKQTKTIRCYISSLPAEPKQLLHIARRHWAIENELHWILDVALKEDHSRVRKDQAPVNFAVLRQMALNLLKQEKTARGGIHAKQLQAAWKEDYLLKISLRGSLDAIALSGCVSMPRRRSPSCIMAKPCPTRFTNNKPSKPRSSPPNSSTSYAKPSTCLSSQLPIILGAEALPRPSPNLEMSRLHPLGTFLFWKIGDILTLG